MNNLSPETHEFIPEQASLQITEGNTELRRKGLVVIDVSVRNYIRSVESKENEEGKEDSKLEGVVKTFLEHVKNKYLENPDLNYRIGGLMSLACTALALEKHLSQFSEKFIKMALLSFYDQDTRVRYYACESLYNVVKKSKCEALNCIGEIFDGICKLTCDSDEDVKYAAQILNRLLLDTMLEFEEVPLEVITDMLANRIFVLNPFIRHLIISWIVTLSSVPKLQTEVDMIKYLPKVYLGLFNMLADNNKDVRNAAESCLNEFLKIFRNKYSETDVISEELLKVVLLNCKRTEQVIKLQNLMWMKTICEMQPQIIHFKGFYEFLDFVIGSLEDTNEEINRMGNEVNKLLNELVTKVKSLSYMDQVTKTLTERLLETQNEQVIVTVLDWFCLMLEISPRKMDSLAEYLSKSVICCFKQSHSQMIMELTMKTFFLIISLGERHFNLLAGELLELFRRESKLLEESGRTIVLNLCKQVGFERFYTIITKSMKLTKDEGFLHNMVHSLNWTLLTSKEAQEFREDLLTQDKKELANQLQDIWSHNMSSALSLALWTEKYDLAQEIVDKISKASLNLEFLVNLDQIVQLLDTHIFIRLRLHLLKPERYPNLLKALLGISMILPQNETNRQLMRRLKISQLTLLGQKMSAYKGTK